MTRKMRTKKTSHGKLIGGLLACIIIITCCIWFFLFRGLAAKGEKVFFITSNDNITNIYNKIEPSCRPIQFAVFKWLVGLSGYENHIRPGRYAINTQGALLTLRNLRNGHQAAVHLTIPSVRKLEDMADIICKKCNSQKKNFYPQPTTMTFANRWVTILKQSLPFLFQTPTMSIGISQRKSFWGK